MPPPLRTKPLLPSLLNPTHPLLTPTSLTRTRAHFLLPPRPSSSSSFTTTRPTLTSNLYSSPTSNPHRAYYQTHGRAVFKCLTLAFFTYQVLYWTWLTLETEETKERTNREIGVLEGEVRALDEERGGKAQEE